MAKFQRLTRDDLKTLTRVELLERIDAEQQWWARKETRGLTVKEQEARREFSDILWTVLDPARLADALGETAAWLGGKRSSNSSWWQEKPGVDRPTPEIPAGFFSSFDPALPSPDQVEAARTPAGGWTREQLAAWGVPWPPPKGWKQTLANLWQTTQEDPSPNT